MTFSKRTFEELPAYHVSRDPTKYARAVGRQTYELMSTALGFEQGA